MPDKMLPAGGVVKRRFRLPRLQRALLIRDTGRTRMCYGFGEHGGRLMSVFDLLFGRPLSTSEERGERLGPVSGIPVFGLDALSSAAYGPEAALALLIVLGTVGIA